MRVRIEGSVPLVAEITRGAVQELALEPGASVWSAVKATEVDVYPA
ncbi:MAG: TOBE domain-containing protein [Micromonosporaceae bacterium]